MIQKFDNFIPDCGRAAFVAWNAHVCGQVVLGTDSSVWYGATVRGDTEPIRIGDGTNIQENCVIHTDLGMPADIGSMITVGHGVILHGCTVHDGSLIGMGAIILNNAVIGTECIVGAGSLVTEGKKFPPRSLILGSPAKMIRELTMDEVSGIKTNTLHYIMLAKKTAAGVKDEKN